MTNPETKIFFTNRLKEQGPALPTNKSSLLNNNEYSSISEINSYNSSSETLNVCHQNVRGIRSNKIISTLTSQSCITSLPSTNTSHLSSSGATQVQISTSSNKFSFSIYYQNVRGLRTKTHELLNQTSDAGFDIIAFTETWLSADVCNSELFENHLFNVYRADRDPLTTGLSRGGGVLLAIANDHKVDLLSLHWKNFCFIDIVGVKISCKHKSLYVFCIYISQKTPILEFEEFFNSLAEYVIDLGHIIILGDFNLYSFKSSISAYNDFLSFTNLDQCNSIPNNINRSLDVVIHDIELTTCEVKRDFNNILEEDPYHPSLAISLEMKHFKLFKTQLSDDVKQYNFGRANFTALYEALQNVDWSFLRQQTNVNAACAFFYSKLYEVLDKFVPKMKKCKRKYPVWFSPELKKMLLSKNRLFMRYKINKSQFFYTKFTEIRKQCKTKQRLDYQAYLDKIKDNLKEDPKQFWSFIRGKRDGNCMPQSMTYLDRRLETQQEIAAGFAEYFSSVFNSPDDRHSETTVRDVSCCAVTSVTIDEVIGAGRRLKGNRCAGCDAIPEFLIKDCIYVMAEPLHFIFNLSLDTTTFPEVWKEARVVSIFKDGDRNNISKYRPISILPNFSKMFEYILHRRLSMSLRSQISEHQHGFIPGRSTLTNLAQFSEFLSQSLDLRNQVDVVYLDLSKAFDKVLHTRLLSKLECFGISTPLLKLFSSYLADRPLRVVIDGYASESYFQRSGVPQGSTLGPLLFVLFINDLPEMVSQSFISLFADDAKVAKTINTIDDCLALQDDLRKIDLWCEQNGLELNPSKCSIVSYSRKQSKIQFNYQVCNFPAKRSSMVRDLGILYDDKLSFSSHITEITSSAYKLLGFVIRNAKPFKDVRVLKLLYFCLVRSKLEYCSLAWYPIYTYQSLALEKVQRRFLKFLFFVETGTYPERGVVESSLLNRFELSSLKQRRDIASIKFVYNLVHDRIDCIGLMQQLCFLVPRFNSRHQEVFKTRRCMTNLGRKCPLFVSCKNFNCVSYGCDMFYDSLASICATASTILC